MTKKNKGKAQYFLLAIAIFLLGALLLYSVIKPYIWIIALAVSLVIIGFIVYLIVHAFLNRQNDA